MTSYKQKIEDFNEKFPNFSISFKTVSNKNPFYFELTKTNDKGGYEKFILRGRRFKNKFFIKSTDRDVKTISYHFYKELLNIFIIFAKEREENAEIVLTNDFFNKISIIDFENIILKDLNYTKISKFDSKILFDSNLIDVIVDGYIIQNDNYELGNSIQLLNNIDKFLFKINNLQNEIDLLSFKNNISLDKYNTCFINGLETDLNLHLKNNKFELTLNREKHIINLTDYDKLKTIFENLDKSTRIKSLLKTDKKTIFFDKAISKHQSSFYNSDIKVLKNSLLSDLGYVDLEKKFNNILKEESINEKLSKTTILNYTILRFEETYYVIYNQKILYKTTKKIELKSKIKEFYIAQNEIEFKNNLEKISNIRI